MMPEVAPGKSLDKEIHVSKQPGYSRTNPSLSVRDNPGFHFLRRRFRLALARRARSLDLPPISWDSQP